jgi:hypothetical protein
MLNQNNNQNNSTPGKAAALLARIKEARENVAALKELWIMLFGEPSPGEHQFMIWLNRYPFDIIEDAFAVVAEWLNRHHQALELIQQEEGRQPNDEEIEQHTKVLSDLIRYASGVMAKKMKGEIGPLAKPGQPYDRL